jgi:anti-sigma regulatory factor (Ser/Thr protein kinase)
MQPVVSFPPDRHVLRQIRADVRSMAARLGGSPQVSDTIALVVDELVNNAIEHGAVYRSKGLDLSVALFLVNGRLRVEFTDPEMPPDSVRDLAGALVQAANGMPSLDNERGRGLFLLTVYLEDLRAEVAATGGLTLAGTIGRD